MTGIRTSTGLISGIDIGGLVDALINAERAPIRRLESRLANLQTVRTGLGQLQAQLLALSTSVAKLADRNTFASLSVQNSSPQQLSVLARSTALPGTYQFQTVRLATSHQVLSRGFANADTQQIGAAGQLQIARGGELARPVTLDVLNDGQGVRRGVIRITDRSGTTVDVDLRNAVTVADVVDAINSQATGVRAEVRGDRLHVTDLTGETAANLAVSDIGNGQTAADLGLAQSVAASTLTGGDVFNVTDQFTLDLLNDGNPLRQAPSADDLSITLADGTTLDIDLDGAANIADVLQKINGHDDNGGKLTAELSDGRIVLTDNTTGSEALAVANLAGSNAVEFFGLTAASSGGVLTGQALSGGMNSVLLRNLRGGQGIDVLGEISLTDRSGATATVDLSNAETLDDVLSAINSAPLALRAELDAARTGIVIRDTSGSTANNLVIADVGAGTLAADLGIAIDSAADSVSSGNLGRRRLNEASSLDTYSPRGGKVTVGSFRIEDSAGNHAVINITSAAKTLGDVIDRINTATGIDVTARLNDTGDGIVIVDDAAGTGSLAISEVGSRTAADLRLLGAATVGGDGKQRIVSRHAMTIDVAATDTLNSIVGKVNAIGGNIRASVVNTGATLNGFRLSLNSTIAGDAGRFWVDDGGLGMGLADQVVGRDAVLRVGGDPATAFLRRSSSNTFVNAVAGVDVSLLQPDANPAVVTLSADTGKTQAALQEFVAAYNAYIDLAAALTKYDAVKQARAPLQGSSTPLLIQTRFNSLVNRVIGSAGDPIRSLADAGIRLTAGGKLTLDADRLTEALRDHPTEVRAMFADVNTGFGKLFDQALDGFNDATTGTLTVQANALQASADQMINRIAQLDQLLSGRRARLERQFVQMETVLGNLQSQQQSLTGLTSILANLRAKE
jgi:flagellar hook-associated protein 2